MHILFLSPRFSPSIGGVEKHVYSLSKQLLSLGHEVTIITEDDSLNTQSDYKKENIEGITVYYFNFGKKGSSKKFTIWKLLLKYKELFQKADIVHCHDVFIWYLPLWFILWNKPVYTTFHGYEQYPIPFKNIVIRKISELLSWGNICIGDFIKKWYHTKPTFVSYGAVDIPQEIKEYENKESAIFFGRLDEQTGILEYITAYEHLKKTHKNFSLQVIGNGNLKEKIVVKSEKFKKNISEDLQKNHFAFISRYLSILEALAYKRPIIAVYNNPLKEDYLKMAEFAPYISIVKSADEIIDKAEYFLSHPQEEKEMINNGYEWVKDQTWGKLANTYLRLWSKT